MSYCSSFFGLFNSFSFMRLAARMKLLFIAAVNHIYCCNSWRPTWSHSPTEVCCDWRYGYREDTFGKGHLCFMTEFTASARETDVSVCWELLWWQELPASPSRLSPSNEAVTNRGDPSAQLCCLSVLLARRLWLCVTENRFCFFPWGWRLPVWWPDPNSAVATIFRLHCQLCKQV